MASNSTRTIPVNFPNCIFITPDFDLNDMTLVLPKSVVPTWIFLSVFNGTAVLPTVLINLLIIWTIIENRRLRKTNYNLLLAALAASDLFVGAVAQPMVVSYMVCLVINCSSPCKTFAGAAMVAMFATFFTLSTLMLLSIERYFAVQHPFYYRQKITNKKVMLVVLILWIIFPLMSILSRVLIDSSLNIRKLSIFVFLSSNATIILFCTVKVHMTAYKKRRSITTANSSMQLVEQQKEYKRSLTTGIMVVASVVLYTPFITLSIIETVFGLDVTRDFKYLSQLVSTTFLFFQSLLNPLIFALRLSYIYQGVKGKIICTSSKREPAVVA